MSISSTIAPQLHFFTTAPKDATIIRNWIEENASQKPRIFYASFINWCIKLVSRARDPNTKYRSEDQKQHEKHVVDQISTYPADTKKFVGLMEHYMRQFWQDGNLRSGVLNPESSSQKDANPLFLTGANVNDVDKIAVNNAQRELYEICFSKAERREHQKEKGTGMTYFDENAKKRAERKRQKKARRLDAAAKEIQHLEDADDEGANEDVEQGREMTLPIRDHANVTEEAKGDAKKGGEISLPFRGRQ